VKLSSGWIDRLRAKGLRVTCCRRGVLTAMTRHGAPMTVDELSRAVHRNDLHHRHDLSTLYRNVESLQEAGIVRRVDFGDGTARYELDEGHEHYVRCTRCGRTDSIGKCDVDRLTRQVERELGYAVTGHLFHLTGVCKRCRG